MFWVSDQHPLHGFHLRVWPGIIHQQQQIIKKNHHYQQNHKYHNKTPPKFSSTVTASTFSFSLTEILKWSFKVFLLHMFIDWRRKLSFEIQILHWNHWLKSKILYLSAVPLVALSPNHIVFNRLVAGFQNQMLSFNDMLGRSKFEQIWLNAKQHFCTSE